MDQQLTEWMDRYFRTAGYGIRPQVLEDGDLTISGWEVFDASGNTEGDEGCWHPTMMAVWRWWRDRVAAHNDDEQFARLVRRGCARDNPLALKTWAWAYGKGEDVPDLVRCYYRKRDLRGSRPAKGWIKRAPAIAQSPRFAVGPQALIRSACYDTRIE